MYKRVVWSASSLICNILIYIMYRGSESGTLVSSQNNQVLSSDLYLYETFKQIEQKISVAHRLGVSGFYSEAGARNNAFG